MKNSRNKNLLKNYTQKLKIMNKKFVGGATVEQTKEMMDKLKLIFNEFMSNYGKYFQYEKNTKQYSLKLNYSGQREQLEKKLVQELNNKIIDKNPSFKKMYLIWHPDRNPDENLKEITNFILTIIRSIDLIIYQKDKTQRILDDFLKFEYFQNKLKNIEENIPNTLENSKIKEEKVKEVETKMRENIEKAKKNREAEEKRKVEKEAEEKRKAEKEAEEKRKAEKEAEEKRKAEKEAEEKRKAEKEAEEKRKAEKEAEEKRKAEEKEAEEKRKAEKEAEEKRKAEKEAEEKRKAEKEAEEKRKEEIESIKIKQKKVFEEIKVKLKEAEKLEKEYITEEDTFTNIKEEETQDNLNKMKKFKMKKINLNTFKKIGLINTRKTEKIKEEVKKLREEATQLKEEANKLRKKINVLKIKSRITKKNKIKSRITKKIKEEHSEKEDELVNYFNELTFETKKSPPKMNFERTIQNSIKKKAEKRKLDEENKLVEQEELKKRKQRKEYPMDIEMNSNNLMEVSKN